MISMLAEAGCPMEDLSERNECPVHLAARAGHTTMVKHLVDLKCDVDKRGGMDGRLSVAQLAAEESRTDLLRTLHNMKYDLRACRGTFSWSLLHVAVVSNQPESIRMLLAVRCDANAIDDRGATPLLHAVVGGRLDALKALTAGGA